VSPRAAADGAEAVCTMVGYPADVEAVIMDRMRLTDDAPGWL